MQQFMKNFLNSLMMHVVHNKGASGLTKQQDEMAYIRLIEDLCRYSFSSPANYPVLLAVKTCLHKSFITQPKVFDVILTGIKTFVDRVKDHSAPQIAQAPLQDVPGVLDKTLQVDSSVDFLTFALERLSLKVGGTPPKQEEKK